MRTRFLLSFGLALTLMAGAQAQLKIGFADANYVLTLMPESQQVQSELTSHETMIQSQLEAKYRDYQTKLQEYQEGAATMDEFLRQSMEADLIAMEQSIQDFQQTAQSSILQKQQDLLQPLFTKIGQAIEAVAVENGYDFIFSAGAQGVDILLYAKQDKDVTDLILAKLGIDAPSE